MKKLIIALEEVCRFSWEKLNEWVTSQRVNDWLSHGGRASADPNLDDETANKCAAIQGVIKWEDSFQGSFPTCFVEIWTLYQLMHTVEGK